jgi:ribosomal protein S21
MEVVVTATGSPGKCSLLYAPSAAKRRKYLLSLPTAGRSIVAIATEKSDRADNAGLTTEHTRAGDTWPVYASGMWRRTISMEVSIRKGESRDCLLCRFQRMVPMSGILRQAKSHRHFPGKDYEIKQKEEHYLL